MPPTRNGSARRAAATASILESTPLSSRHLNASTNGHTNPHPAHRPADGFQRHRDTVQDQEHSGTQRNGPTTTESATHLPAHDANSDPAASRLSADQYAPAKRSTPPDPRTPFESGSRHHGLPRKRQTHDVVTSLCMFVLMPTALVILLVYIVMLCRYYSCVRNALRLSAALVEAVLWSGPIRMCTELAGVPVIFGMAVSLYYLVIFYFNSDVPGVRPPLPQVSWQTGVRADPNYSFGLLLGLVCLVVYSLPEILLFHSTRIYSAD